MRMRMRKRKRAGAGKEGGRTYLTYLTYLSETKFSGPNGAVKKTILVQLTNHKQTVRTGNYNNNSYIPVVSIVVG